MAPKKQNSKPKSPRLLVWSILAIFLAAAIFYAYIDQKVVRALRLRESHVVPIIYSDMRLIEAKSHTDLHFLIDQLEDRRYRRTNSSPRNTGEYWVSGNTLEIVTHEFTAADSATYPSTRIIYDFERGEMKNEFGSTVDYFYLEPKPISTLGASDQRASEYTSIDKIPNSLQQAVIAIEDNRFYKHFGVDLSGILRALIANIMAGRVVQGGSTITQQLAKNLLFSPQRTIARKLLELMAALSIESRISKSEILELYLNEVYLGQEGPVAIHGVAEASNAFFSKKLEQLTLAESALLAALIRAPSFTSPRKHLDRALERKDLVLQRMQELGVISENQRARAASEKIKIIGEIEHQRSAPFYTSALNQELSRYINMEAVTGSGLRVYTGIDADLQNCAERALKRGLESLEANYPKLKQHQPALESGLVAIEPFSGKIRAWVGGREYSQNQFDHVSQAKRQIGSTVKPFLYLTALDHNLNNYKVATVLSVIPDRPMKVELITKDTWEPENYDKAFRGDVTLRYALENSLNMPAVYVGQRVGAQALVRTLQKFRVVDKALAVPSLALGAVDTSLLHLSSGFAALANQGNYVVPRLFLSAIDSNNEIIVSNPIFEEKIAGEEAIYVLTNILQGVVERGTGKVVRNLGYNGVAAGKTGTSNEMRDAWFVGYTPSLASGVWVGFDDNDKIGLSGAQAAAPIWANFMQCAEPYQQSLEFLIPPGVVMREVDASTAQLATDNCPSENIVKEVFVYGSEPRQACKLHGGTPKEEAPQSLLPDSSSGSKKRKRSFWDVLFGR